MASQRLEFVRYRLRAFGLSGQGNAIELIGRQAMLDDLRRRFGSDPTPLRMLKKDDAKAMLVALDVGGYRTAKDMIDRLVRLATAPEPSPAPAKAADLWDVIWTNPATLREEVYEGGLSRAKSASVQHRVAEYLSSMSSAIERWLPADDGVRNVQRVPQPHSYPPRDHSEDARLAEQILQTIVGLWEDQSHRIRMDSEAYINTNREIHGEVKRLKEVRERIRNKTNPPRRHR